MKLLFINLFAICVYTTSFSHSKPYSVEFSPFDNNESSPLLKQNNDGVYIIEVDFIMTERFVYNKMKNNIDGNYFLSETGEKFLVVHSVAEAFEIISKNGFGEFSSNRILIQTVLGTEESYKVQFDLNKNTHSRIN